MPQIPSVSDETNTQKISSNCNEGANQQYTIPEYDKKDFHCPHCNVYALQIWEQACKYGNYTLMGDIAKYPVKGSKFSFCYHCKKYSIWVNQKMVYPHLSTAPLPTAEMPESVKELYNEARIISNQSPRGACALLRLAIQLLVKELEKNEKNLNKAIKHLVEKGLPEKIQKSLDAVRVIGNNAVHPGEINIKDNPEIANSLFMLVNFISEKMITENRMVDTIYNSLPEDKIEAINKRDNRVDNH